jgi:hypothetical protein
MSTVMTARVRSVTAAATAPGSRFIVRGSTSTRTGLARKYRTTSPVAANV